MSAIRVLLKEYLQPNSQRTSEGKTRENTAQVTIVGASDILQYTGLAAEKLLWARGRVG